ncbi:hypothetical protein VMCG_05142 [Cytospora schulzeri]|uniref:Uncharacterized protein n=1 Tax=Cytospora schulzeri TaxID=448051 RepID=A0A423WQV2_9PEZI|nr:hypothetical protein VMCG_05142 [Valsa malicola]
MAYFNKTFVSRATKTAKAVREARFTKKYTPLPPKSLERHFSSKPEPRNFQAGSRHFGALCNAHGAYQEELRGSYRDRSDRPTAEARLRSRSLSPGRSPRPERTPSRRTIRHIATILGYGEKMVIDVESSGEVHFEAKMDLDTDESMDFDVSTDMEIDSDVDVCSTFSSSVGSAHSFSTAMSSPPQPTRYLPALRVIDFDIEMKDVFEMVETPLDNPSNDSSLVPTEHQTYIESTTPPGSPAAYTSSLVVSTTPLGSPSASSTLIVHPTTTPTIAAQPHQNVVQFAPVYYYARAAGEDFIKAQRLAESTALPVAEDTDLGESRRDDLEVPANTRLPSPDEEGIHLTDAAHSEIIAQGEPDHTLSTGTQVDPQGEIISEATSTPPATDQEELAEPTIQIDTEMAGPDEEEGDGEEWETVFDVNGVTAPQAPVSNPVAAAPSPLHSGGMETDHAQDAEDTASTDDEESPEYIEEYFAYDVECAQEIMNDFLCEKLPEIAAQVMFPATNFTVTAQSQEAELFAAWFYGQGLPEEASDLVEAAFEEKAEMSGEELGDLIWEWYQERVFAELQGYEVPFSEEDTELLDERMAKVLDAHFNEPLSGDYA